MIRLRVSTIEQFRRVIQTDFADQIELIERIKRGQWTEGPSSWQMDAGTAWHKALAGVLPAGDRPSDQHDGGECRYGEYTFSTLDIVRAQREASPGLCEVTRRRGFEVPAWRVEVEGTADHVHGLAVTDHKTCFSGADCRDYEPSLQWRFYLAIHGAQCFRYLLYDFKPPKEGYCELKAITACRFWAYPSLEADCRAWLGRFLDWSQSKGLIPFLERRSA